MTPDQVTVCSNKKVWWKCKNGHEYEASINQRTRKERGEGCPYCANKKLLPGFNDLKTVCPEVAVEWHHFEMVILGRGCFCILWKEGLVDLFEGT